MLTVSGKIISERVEKCEVDIQLELKPVELRSSYRLLYLFVTVAEASDCEGADYGNGRKRRSCRRPVQT